MDFYELKNKYFSLVRKKMINDYKMGNIDFMESEELLDHIIERIGVYQDHGKSDDESIASAFSDFHRKLLALRPLTLGYTVGASYDGQSTIPEAEYVSVFRGLVGTEFADESMATKFAERDGVKLIFGFPPIPDGLYVDTEKNRKIIEEYLNSVASPGIGVEKMAAKAKDDILLEEVDALETILSCMKIEDITIKVVKGRLIADDADGNHLEENEIYDFILNECLAITPNGDLARGLCIKQEFLDSVLHYAAQREVKVNRLTI